MKNYLTAAAAAVASAAAAGGAVYLVTPGQVPSARDEQLAQVVALQKEQVAALKLNNAKMEQLAIANNAGMERLVEAVERPQKQAAADNQKLNNSIDNALARFQRR